MESKGDKIENEIKALKMIEDAVKENPDIICLSELFLSWGKDFNGRIVEVKDIVKYKILAKNNNVNIILGSVALKSNINGKTTNTCFVINRRGEIIKRYDKNYMYKANKKDFVVDELKDTIPGNEIGVTEVDGVKIGIGICFDLRFPEYFRKLIGEGVQIIFLPSHFRTTTGKKHGMYFQR